MNNQLKKAHLPIKCLTSLHSSCPKVILPEIYSRVTRNSWSCGAKFAAKFCGKILKNMNGE